WAGTVVGPGPAPRRSPWRAPVVRGVEHLAHEERVAGGRAEQTRRRHGRAPGQPGHRSTGEPREPEPVHPRAAEGTEHALEGMHGTDLVVPIGDHEYRGQVLD